MLGFNTRKMRNAFKIKGSIYTIPHMHNPGHRWYFSFKHVILYKLCP